MAPNRSIAFFDAQFEKQVATSDYALNPFEERVLPFVRGRVLDFGCGLGNLSIEAARSGADVVAVDASPARSRGFNGRPWMKNSVSRQSLPT